MATLRARFLFSRLTVSRCSSISSLEDFTRKNSELKLRHSIWLPPISPSLQILRLQPPLVDNLVKVAAALLDDGGVGLEPLALGGQVVQLGLIIGLAVQSTEVAGKNPLNPYL